MEICLLHAQWSDFWSAISVTRVQRLGFTTDANVSLSYPPSKALQLVSISVVCSLFVHHMFPSENSHIQAHGWSSLRGRLQPFHVWVLLPTPVVVGHRKDKISAILSPTQSITAESPRNVRCAAMQTQSQMGQLFSHLRPFRSLSRLCN